MSPSGTPRGCAILLAVLALAGCREKPDRRPEPPPFEPGQAFVACGERFDIGTPVVLWSDPIGFDAYSERCRFSDQVLPSEAASKPEADASALRYGVRSGRPGTLRELRQILHLVVIHYDAVGSSERCFRGLHDARGLSSHFLLDLDGTLYQTLDLRERAFHAKDVNDESVGIEIANAGAHSTPKLLQPWYGRDETGLVRNLFSPELRLGAQRRRDVVPRPARPELVAGWVHGKKLVQYDFTPEQYEALPRLLAGLAKAFPRLRLEAPRDRQGRVPADVVPRQAVERFDGLVGHYHLDPNKLDPGPAFDWDRVIADARALVEGR